MSTQSKQTTRRIIAFRAALGGLISSSLSASDLKKFAEIDLNLEFVFELRHALTTLQLPGDVQLAPEFPDIPYPGHLVEIILDEVKRRRLSKRQVFEYMREIDFGLTSLIDHPDRALRESIDFFVSHSAAETGNLLLSRVLGVVPQDPFLTGISKRK